MPIWSPSLMLSGYSETCVCCCLASPLLTVTAARSPELMRPVLPPRSRASDGLVAPIVDIRAPPPSTSTERWGRTPRGNAPDGSMD